MYRLGVITDEIDADFERALVVAQELGLREVELNGLWGRNVLELSDEELDRAEQHLKEGEFRVCALSTPVFKAVLLDDVNDPADSTDVRTHLDALRKGCALAVRFGTPRVRIFSFRKSGIKGMGNPSPRLPEGGEIPEEMLQRIASGLLLAAEIAQDFGVTLVVENVRSCWGNSCRNTARILGAADHPSLKMVWDPGNDYVSGGDPFPGGYEHARPWMAHVHMKNASVVDPASGLTRWERIGGGDLEIVPMLDRLRADAYDGAVVLETHWRGEGMTPEESTRASFSDLMQLL